MLILEIDRVLEIIGEKGYKKVGLQLPEGLKTRALEIADKIEVKGASDVVIFGDPCFGACDLAEREAKEMGCDALFHFGHSRIFPGKDIPVHYIEVKIDHDPLTKLEKNLDHLPKKIGLITTVQHQHLLEKISSHLEDKGFKPTIGPARGRVEYNGQVLGCSFSTAKDISYKVDGFLYIGTGDFHPLGVALSTGKKTFSMNLELGELRDMDTIKETILRMRFARIARAMDSRSFGIIVGEKKGQRRLELAKELKKKIQEKGKKAYLIAMDMISPDNLMPFLGIDTFVNTACPRISIDDAQRYKKPLLTPIELEIAIGIRKWEDYSMDEII